MSDIVEWLREMQGDYEGSATFIDYAGHYKEAADRIEALERDQAEDDERIALLEQHAKNQKSRINTLEAALREIDAYTAEGVTADIVRRALEEGR